VFALIYEGRIVNIKKEIFESPIAEVTVFETRVMTVDISTPTSKPPSGDSWE